MYCKNCHTFRPDGVAYCNQCGEPLVEVKKGHLWIPIAILVSLCAVGTAVFFLI